MSLRNKKSSSSLVPAARQGHLPSTDYSLNSNMEIQHGKEHKIEKPFKRMSVLFHRSKTEDGTVPTMGIGQGKKSHIPSATTNKSTENSPEIPLPQSSSNSSTFYSVRNNSSGTLISRQPSFETHTYGINNVEFNNIRNNSIDYYDGADSIMSPTSASFVEKTKDTKFARFLSKTGQKVKKMSDISGDQINHGLGLHSQNHGHGHGHNHGLPELNIQSAFLLGGTNNKEIKSPITRGFGKTDQKLSLGDKLKLPTKYKNYHYHSLLRNKKDSFKKLGSKNNDLANGYLPNSILAGSSIALYGINYVDLERMIDSDVLNFDQCEQYCNFLFDRLHKLIMPLFKGETLQASIEDITKLVSLYVRLRKSQECGNRDRSLDSFQNVNGMKKNDSNESTNNSFVNTINASNMNNNSQNVDYSMYQSNSNNKTINTFGNDITQSQNSLNSTVDEVNEFETPFMKPTATFVNSPTTAELRSPTAFSPIMKMRSSSFIAISKILEELNELLKHGIGAMIGQLYYDETTDSLKFMRGNNPILRKRKIPNSHLSSGHADGPEFHNNNYFNNRKSSTGLYVPDMGLSSSTKSVFDLPVLTPTQTTNSFDVRQGGGGNNNEILDNTVYDSSYYGHMDDINTNEVNNLHSDWNNLNNIPVGKFEKCTSILWDVFQRTIIFELSSILLPIELEFANGHEEISKVHNKANSILYNRGEKIVNFTNTLVYPDISNCKNLKNENSKKEKGNSIVGSLGEWGEINIRNILLVGFRDYIVIPLYEMNRQFEDIDGLGVDLERIRSDKRSGQLRKILSDKSVNNSSDSNNNKKKNKKDKNNDNDTNNTNNGKQMIEEYSDAYTLLQCFRLVSSVGTNDTNQKLVENLLVQMRTKCLRLESM